MRRQYVSIDHYHAPFRGAVLQGVGDDVTRSGPSPAGRVYYELSQFRSPYRHGYYQDNTLMGLGADMIAGANTAIGQLQRALGVQETGVMDGATQAGIRSQQAKHNLPVTGAPDAALLVALGLISPSNIAPAASTWRRDLGTALSQVPPWAYGVLSAALFGAAYISYKRFKKTQRGSTAP